MVAAAECSIETISEDQRRELLDFYAAHGHSPTIGVGERVAVGRARGAIVAAARLCIEHDHMVLRTVQVAASHQRRGVGSAVVRHALSLSDGTIFCIPFAHVLPFYTRLGFILAPAPPPFLVARAARYTAGGDAVVVAVRPALRRT